MRPVMKTAIPLVLSISVLVGCGSSTPFDATATPAPAAEPITVEFGSIDAALAGAHRSQKNRDRDRYRHPRETLAFMGVQPNMTVIELWPGGGWYTEVLAPYVHDAGRLVAVLPEQRAADYRTFLATHPRIFDRVEVRTVVPPEQISFGPDGSADAVLTFRNVHNWEQGGYAEAMFAAAFRVLKPGGVFGVVDHRAPEGSPAAQNPESGYITEARVIALATGAGFALEDRSEINANPNDTHDHPEGVWTLPPVLRLGEQDRERYLAIGESDRMTLRFRKPAAE
jgi:predicted methyltransferase